MNPTVDSAAAWNKLPKATSARASGWAHRVAPALYPGVMILGLGCHILLGTLGVATMVSAYLSAALGAAAIIVLERWLPHRQAWRADGAAYRTDFLYLVLVQVSLPVLLALAAASIVDGGSGALSVLWPHDWPVGLQFVTMLVIADGLRYWLHVAAHRWPPLWRLHAVHHSPSNLYWLNTARFHPLEKTVQYALDSLPFALMGVHQEVIALYLVFYALNGFLQHANIHMRLGWLNYLVSGPELHRWHHSRDPREAAVNFGNNLIVWDLLFGTRFLPTHRQVAEVGLRNDRYPQSFNEQLVAPAVAGIDHRPGVIPGWSELIVNWLIHCRMSILRLTAWPRLVAAAKNPRAAQHRVLTRILRENRSTRFFEDHNLSGFESYETFRERVPVQDYETLRPYIQGQLESGAPELTREAPFMFARTSGTTGEPKYLPVLRRSLKELRRSQDLYAMIQHRVTPEAYAGRLLLMASPAEEGRMPNGVPFGSASGQLLRTMSRLMREKHVIPAEVFEIEDYQVKYRLMLRLALVEKNITAMGAANPSSILMLQRLLQEQRLELLEELRHGVCRDLAALPVSVRRAVKPRLACTPARLAELDRILRTSKPELGDLWPHLALLATWTGGSCGIALDAVRASLPASTRVTEIGYIASELRATIPVDAASRSGLPTLHQHFFEFVEKERWDSGQRSFLTLDELRQGREYYVLVTTASGLYRYFMNDIVRVTGRFHGTPTLEFLQKGRGTTSITGEKLYESQVIEAVKRSESELGFTSSFFVLLADPQRSVYRLLLETAEPLGTTPGRVADTVDGWLGKLNLEYAQKRASGRLRAPLLTVLERGAGDRYKRFCIESGQRESQFKVQALQYRGEFRFPFSDLRPVAGSERS